MSGIARTLAWDDVRLVNVIAEAGSLPAAAAASGLDHSTVFRRLRQIERALGTVLFERHRSGYVPTVAGAEIVAVAARMEAEMTAMLRRVAGQAPSPAGEVRVATSDVLLTELLLPMFAAFQQACPEVRLDLVCGNEAANLSRRDADVAIRASGAPPENLVGRKVARIAWAAYRPAGSEMTETSVAELAGLAVRWVGFGDALAGLAAAGALRRWTAPDRTVARFDTIGGLAGAVAAGLGCGLLPCFVGNGRPGLVRLTGPIGDLATDLWLLTHDDLRQVPRVRALLDFLAERMGEVRDVIEGRLAAGGR